MDPSHWVIGLTFWPIPKSPNRWNVPPPANPAWWKLSVMYIHGVIRHERNYLFRNFQWHLRDMELSRQEKNSVKHFLGIFLRFSSRRVNEIINSEGEKKTLFKKIWMIGVRLSDYPLCSNTGGSSLGFVSWTCSVWQNRIWLTQQKKTSIPPNPPKKISKPNFPNPSITKKYHPPFW